MRHINTKPRTAPFRSAKAIKPSKIDIRYGRENERSKLTVYSAGQEFVQSQRGEILCFLRLIRAAESLADIEFDELMLSLSDPLDIMLLRAIRNK